MTEQLRTLHKAGIVDVNSVAAFLQSSAVDIDFDGDGEPDRFVDGETAAPAFRLFLSHVVLEHGQLWYADDETGIQATALWLPPHPQTFSSEFGHVVSRELGVADLGAGETASAAAQDAAQDATDTILTLIESIAPDLILMDVVLAADPDRGEDDSAELIGEVLRPVLSAPDCTRFAAISFSPTTVASLTEAGFAQIGRVKFGTDVTAWVGAADFGVHNV